MPRKLWDDMTDDEKNDRIATLIGGVLKPCECGFERCQKQTRWHWKPNANPWHREWHSEYQKRPDITDERPDFIHDLNAMHEVEKDIFNGTSGWRIEDDYLRNLSTVIGIPVDKNEAVSPYIASATAEQRAEAFFRTFTDS